MEAKVHLLLRLLPKKMRFNKDFRTTTYSVVLVHKTQINMYIIPESEKDKHEIESFSLLSKMK